MNSLVIKHLFLSPGHNFFGRHGQSAESFPIVEREELHCVAGAGIEGDRFFNFKPNYKGQITFFSEEVYQDLCASLHVHDRGPEVLRRNVITKGADLNEFIGAEFDLQGVRFLGTGECAPCYWMDQAFGPGAEEKLKGRGGLRAKILTSGVLKRI